MGTSGYATSKEQLLDRLNRIKGQVGRIERMLEGGAGPPS